LCFRVTHGCHPKSSAGQLCEPRDYLSIQLDDPSFPGPIRAALFEEDGAARLVEEGILRRPSRGLYELADHQPSARAQDPSHLTEDRSGIFDEAKDCDRDRDVEARRRKGQMLGCANMKLDIGAILLRSLLGCLDHGIRSVDAGDSGAAPPQLDREIAVTAAHVENAVIPHVLEKLEDQSTFETVR